MQAVTFILSVGLLLGLTTADPAADPAPAPAPAPAPKPHPKPAAKPALAYGYNLGYDSDESLESNEYYGNLYGRRGIGSKFGTHKTIGTSGFSNYFGGLGGVPYGTVGGVVPTQFGTVGYVQQPGIYGGLGTGYGTATGYGTGYGSAYGSPYGTTGYKNYGRDYSEERNIGFGGQRFGSYKHGFGGRTPFYYGRHR